MYADSGAKSIGRGLCTFCHEECAGGCSGPVSKLEFFIFYIISYHDHDVPCRITTSVLLART